VLDVEIVEESVDKAEKMVEKAEEVKVDAILLTLCKFEQLDKRK
jgi:hypothetical protein